MLRAIQECEFQNSLTFKSLCLFRKFLTYMMEMFKKSTCSGYIQVFQGWQRGLLRRIPEEKTMLNPLGTLLPLNRTEKQVVGHLKFVENLLWRRLFLVN